MRRLARHLFTLCSAVSLLLCVAACVLWVGSYQSATELYRESGGANIFRNDWFVLAAGRFHWTRREGVSGAASEPYAQNDWDERPLRASERDWGYGISAGHREWRFLGVEYILLVDDPGPEPLWRRGLWLPCSMVTATFAVAPLLWVRAARRRRCDVARAAKHLCRSCGYDLRASPGRCPECGTVPEVTT